MLPFEEALQLVKQASQPLATESIAIHDAFGRILAQDIVADRNYPPFNRAAMDGYALKIEDAQDGITLNVIGELHAGHTTDAVIRQGECLKIMTGSATPPSADLIIRVEDTHQEGNQVTLSFPTPARKGQNLAIAGEDVKQAQKIVSKGTRCTHDILGILAVTGHASISVYKPPTVAIISTGDELKPVGSPVEPHQIRNSNEFTLKGLLGNLGISPAFVTHTPDTKAAIEQAILIGLQEDILILSGGVSMGDADYVPQILKKVGVKQVFHRTAIKPGKPIWFGKQADTGTAVFGLPGNPLSCQVTFKLFIEVYLAASYGKSADWFTLSLAQDKSKKHPLDEFFVCSLNEIGQVVPKKYKGSGDITASVGTHGIAHHPAQEKELKKGDQIRFMFWK
ncbi:MAG: molybdopterin molybdotransferase MoeA [Flammeovirgaceae bacterium]